MAMERTVGKNLTANTDNVMFEVRENTAAKVVLLYIANSSSNNIAISVKWFDASTNETYFLVNGYSLAANQYIKLDGSYMKLEAGDKLLCNPAGVGMSSIVTYEATEK
jgi:TRAP-type mannitol/chloroaromatic compound transport system permease small subunit